MPPPERTRRAELGAAGEELAAAWLRAHGFAVLARNLRTTAAEIDILAVTKRILVAIEVKTRTCHEAPERLVDQDRIGRLHQALARLRPTLAPKAAFQRVDVIAVRWSPGDFVPELRHFPGEFARRST